jgi:hypothetical protein
MAFCICLDGVMPVLVVVTRVSSGSPKALVMYGFMQETRPQQRGEWEWEWEFGQGFEAASPCPSLLPSNGGHAPPPTLDARETTTPSPIVQQKPGRDFVHTYHHTHH